MNIKRREEREDIAVAGNIKRRENMDIAAESTSREYKEKRGTRGHSSSSREYKEKRRTRTEQQK